MVLVTIHSSVLVTIHSSVLVTIHSRVWLINVHWFLEKLCKAKIRHLICKVVGVSLSEAHIM